LYIVLQFVQVSLACIMHSCASFRAQASCTEQHSSFCSRILHARDQVTKIVRFDLLAVFSAGVVSAMFAVQVSFFLYNALTADPQNYPIQNYIPL